VILPTKKVSLQAVLALISLGLIFGGMCVSRSPDVIAHPTNLAMDATKHVRDSTDLAPQVFFWLGTIAAGAFIVLHFLGMRVDDPFKNRRGKAD
jgi:hypothetical protein